ncbi:MAG: 3-keto-5-aminohexanoate cleavage protein [Betaproteobacteria bacterium]|nr:3-keto-5-aminohexanoate cleavage protein [Betaproteobacteria bacterium]
MDKLIITACAADTSMHPGVPARIAASNALAAEVEKAWRAGAGIAHIHGPLDDHKVWAEHTQAIRARCDVMIQYGISLQSVERRREVVKNRPEMISVAVGARHYA